MANKARRPTSKFSQISYGTDFKTNLLAPLHIYKENALNLTRAHEKRNRATLIDLFNLNQGYITTIGDIKRFDRFDLYERELIPALGEAMKQKGITAEQVIDELSSIAFSKTDRPFIENDNDLKISSKDKLKALEMLARFLGLFEKDNAQKAVSNQMIQIAFIGDDKKEAIANLNERNNELTKDSIFDDENLKKKSKELLETQFVNFGSPAGNIVGKKPKRIGDGTLVSAKDIEVITPDSEDN